MAFWVYDGGTFAAAMLIIYATMFLKEATTAMGPLVSFIASRITLAGSMAILTKVLFWGGLFALRCSSGKASKDR